MSSSSCVDVAAAHIGGLYGSSDVLKVVALAPRSDAARSLCAVRYASATELSSPTSSVLGWASERNAAGWDVCVGVNPVCRRREPQGRLSYGATAAHVSRFAYVQLDLDRNAHSSLTLLRRDVVAGRLPNPTSVVRTSRAPNKYHLLWALRPRAWGSAGDPNARSAVVDVNRALVRRYGGDPASVDVSRLFRLPGFVNRKAVYLERPVVVTTGVVRRLQGLPPPAPALPGHFDGLLAVARKPPGPAVLALPRRSGRGSGDPLPFMSARATGHRSQSEADWHVVCSQLESGRSADSVASGLATFRDTQARLGRLAAKSRPFYYAVQTVTRAAEKLGLPGPSVTPAQAMRTDAGTLRPSLGPAPERRPLRSTDSAAPALVRRRSGPPPALSF